MTDWQPFAAAVKDATGGNTKIQLAKYEKYGSIPVIDQGKNLVGGYTNDPDAPYSGPIPCIVFGDHTKIFKYVDFPFALGADGVKILAPNLENLDTKFLYHYLASRKLPAAGYSRHFKFLKDIRVPIPPLEEQRRIVAVLDRAAAIRRRADAARAKARAIIPALFLDMFGDPATNPKGWPLRTLDELGELDRGRSRHRPRNAPELYGGRYPFVQTGDVANSNGRITRWAQTYSKAGLAQSRLWPAGTLCITIAANIGKTGILEFDGCFPDSVVGFTPKGDVVPEYVQRHLDSIQAAIEEVAPQAAQKNINLKVLRNLKMPLPPLTLQTAFAEQTQRIEAIGRGLDAAAAKAEALAASLSAEVFG